MKRLSLFGLVLASTTLAASFTSSAACKEYVRCAEATGATKGSLDATYGPAGTCWAENLYKANACTDRCIAELESLVATQPEAHCRPFPRMPAGGCG